VHAERGGPPADNEAFLMAWSGLLERHNSRLGADTWWERRVANTTLQPRVCMVDLHREMPRPYALMKRFNSER
jgi:hypothetical protein